jgi:hypothetical protein
MTSIDDEHSNDCFTFTALFSPISACPRHA